MQEHSMKVANLVFFCFSFTAPLFRHALARAPESPKSKARQLQQVLSAAVTKVAMTSVQGGRHVGTAWRGAAARQGGRPRNDHPPPHWLPPRIAMHTPARAPTHTMVSRSPRETRNMQRGHRGADGAHPPAAAHSRRTRSRNTQAAGPHQPVTAAPEARTETGQHGQGGNRPAEANTGGQGAATQNTQRARTGSGGGGGHGGTAQRGGVGEGMRGRKNAARAGARTANVTTITHNHPSTPAATPPTPPLTVPAALLRRCQG